MTRWCARLGALIALCAAMVAVAPAGGAAAHPLGNFTVNHYDGLRLYADRVDLLAVVDHAEIPTLQERPLLDTDADGVVSADEARGRADAECAALAAGVVVTVDGAPLTWSVQGAELTLPPGEAGLSTTRIECRISAPAELGGTSRVDIADGYLADRIGWREMAAVGDGVRLTGSALPTASVSAELRSYPVDLLTDPLDVRSATLRVEPGAGGGGSGPQLAVSTVGRWLGLLHAWFSRLVGQDDLTVEVGGLAMLLSVVLGASHAMLPGHGKTVMAAYLAGRRGTRRDALLVGASVTATHTASVLVVGLVVGASATFAPDGVLSLLGVLSGLLVAGIGVRLLASAYRAWRAGSGDRTVASHRMPAGHGHGHAGFGRGALVGLGVAGGLVPSPTALLVLLGAVGLGRTWFGVGLALAYGLGMAATLTAAGLLLLGLRDRLDRFRPSDGLRRRTARLVAATPVLTALLVLVVGIGLTARGVAGSI